MTKKKILALDIATITGWATETASGTWNLKPNRGESEGMRVVRFVSKVREIIDMEKITVVVYERPAGKHKSSIMVASEMIGGLKALCEEKEVEYGCKSAGEIKKFFTGNGAASKSMMVEEATRRFPHISIIDDNHADALALLELAKTNI